VNVLDVLEAQCLELRNRLTAAETTGAIEKHGFSLVECAKLSFETFVTEGDVHRLGRSPPSNSPFERLIGVQIFANPVRRGFEEAVVPTALIPTPKDDDGGDDDDVQIMFHSSM
jgi:hypothetical protein